jgi:hypothetical protein
MTRRRLMGVVGASSLWPAMAMSSEAASSPVFSQRHDPAPFEALLRLDASQSGAGNHRWATVLDGEITGGSWVGPLLSGRLDWHVDPASGAAEAVATCRVRGPQGRALQLRHVRLTATRLDNGLVLLRAAA